MTKTAPTDASAAVARRTVLRGAVLAGAAVPFLVACGSDDEEPAAEPAAEETSPPEDVESSAAGAEPIASTADVPEGGGLILEDPKIVITQPVAGEFKGFSSICTHQGCPVDSVADGTINCPCHGSKYSIEDGSVVGGPAPAPLAEMAVTVTGEDISLA